MYILFPEVVDKDWHKFKHTLDAWQIDLVEAACSSDEVSGSAFCSQLLRYLAVHSHPDHKEQRTTKNILAEIFPGTKNNVPARISELQGRLDNYFQSVGSIHEQKIVINRSVQGIKNPNKYVLEYKPNHGLGSYTRSFWKDYLQTRVPTIIGYGEPLFETNEDHTVFTRRASCNHERELTDPDLADYPFVTVGEVLAMLDLTTWLKEKDIKRVIHKGFWREHKVSDPMTDFAEANGIFLGTSRVNGVLREYQMYPEFRFYLDEFHIKEISANAQKSTYLFTASEVPVSR